MPIHPIASNDWENPSYLYFDQLADELRRLRLSPEGLVIVEGYLLMCP